MLTQGLRERMQARMLTYADVTQGLRERMQARMYIIHCWTVPNLPLTRQARSGSSAALFDERDITPGILFIKIY
jgi:hypothetical protein